jgi:hypothetical protein
MRPPPHDTTRTLTPETQLRPLCFVCVRVCVAGRFARWCSGDDAAFLGHDFELEWALAQYLGAGTAACYRGPVLYLTNATQVD